MIEPFATEFQRYRVIAEKSLAQVSDAALNHVPMPDGNSLAMLVRHLSGNFLSRFTDFLTTDGEKPWRHRDNEFEERSYSREEINQMWEEGWAVLEQTLHDLSEEDLNRSVQIRGRALTVHAALARSLAHLSYHVGQMVLLARIEQQQAWEWITIPKGQSEQYNANPTKERRLQ
ncbi:MAG TPA: DinB family protein [Rhodothermales bacterium]|nr:DinB family protein [Rhodothermales bacterium]